MAVFDAVVNNADRKGGHLLPRDDGRVQGVDHGICFSAEDKLRTLLWQWRGKPLTDEAVEVLSSLRAELEGAARRRAARAAHRDRGPGDRPRGSTGCCSTGRHPHPSEDWPAIPWPPF